MITIRELLNKIEWDNNEEPNEYKIYYYDRILEQLKELSYYDIIERDNLFFFIVNDDGSRSQIPLHRIKVVKKNNEIIWQRDY